MNSKRRRFVEEYLVDLNATQAAIRAGYSAKGAKQCGSRLLTYDDVQRAISERRDELTARAGVTQEWIIERLKVEAERDDDGASHAARVAALQHLGKHLGIFDKDNQQKAATIVIGEGMEKL